jgi:hypothetical protein
MASSSHLASQIRPKGGPRIISQTLASDFSRREHHFSCFWNSMASLSTTSIRKTLVGERSSMDYAAEDTTARSAVSYMAISIWQMGVIHILSDR